MYLHVGYSEANLIKQAYLILKVRENKSFLAQPISLYSSFSDLVHLLKRGSSRVLQTYISIAVSVCKSL